MQKEKPDTQIETISIEEYLSKRKKVRKDCSEEDYSSEEIFFPFFCNL